MRLSRAKAATAATVLLALTTNAAAQACADSDPIDVTVSSGSDAAGSELCRPNGSRCPIMVDVRAQSEWDAGHVSCATRIPVQDDASRTGEVLTLAGGDSSHPVVVYCYSGARAGRAVMGTDSAFTVTAATWGAGTDADPHVIEMLAAPDNKAAREDLPLAPWS